MATMNSEDRDTCTCGHARLDHYSARDSCLIGYCQCDIFTLVQDRDPCTCGHARWRHDATGCNVECCPCVTFVQLRECVPDYPASRYSPTVEPHPVSELSAIVRQLEPDAVRALTLLAKRLLKGQHAYGTLDIAADPRDWQKEREEELQDALIYSAFATLKKGTKP